MSASAPDLHRASHARPALAPYLQTVAAALAAPDASVERVLQAAQAREVERDVNNAEFRTPDPRFRFAAAYFGSGPEHPLKSVLFVCDDAREPVTVAELAQAFGTWQRVTSGSGLSDTYPIVFDVPYPPPTAAARTRTAGTRVRVSFTAEPTAPGARAREIRLSRSALDP